MKNDRTWAEAPLQGIFERLAKDLSALKKEVWDGKKFREAKAKEEARVVFNFDMVRYSFNLLAEVIASGVREGKEEAEAGKWARQLPGAVRGRAERKGR